MSNESPLRVLRSTEDASVNFVEEALVGFLESRFVRKCEDYFVCYLSSQTGCNRGCTFCHLTVTEQTSFTDSTHNDFVGQAVQVFRHYRSQRRPARYVHYSFMARGEPLANRVLLDSADSLLIKLGEMARDDGLGVKFNVSTIMPSTLRQSLPEVFRLIHPTIYYSLYSADEAFRRSWLPGAMPLDEALRRLHEYQEFSKKVVKVHYPFIAGQNDSVEQVEAVCEAIDRARLICDLNLVRYNPASPAQGQESDEETIEQRLTIIRRRFKGKVQVIPRVGFDVAASCGMFATPA